jgi:ribosomal protein L16 Arg81 hydroxylase
MIDFGMTPRDFRERHFERSPHVFRQSLRDRPLEWSELDSILHLNEPTPQGLQLFNRGMIPDDAYTEDSSAFGLRRRHLNKVRFYGYLNAGATLVINRFELLCVAAQRLCTQVAAFATQPATSNAYVSFRGDGTFGNHWDTHDVFAIQLIGRKRWRVFAPTTPLPLSHQTNERSGQACPETPVLDCILDTGDVLYIPRGWWHHVIPLEEGSLHLSVGTYAPTMYDYVMWACSHSLPDDLLARSAFEPSAASFASLLDRIGAALKDPENVAQFHQQIVQRERTTSEFNLDLFVSPQSPKLDPQTRVRLNSCYPRQSADSFVVNGATLQLDPLSSHLIGLLTPASATLAELETKVNDVPADTLRRSVLNLNRYEIVSLEIPADR